MITSRTSKVGTTFLTYIGSTAIAAALMTTPLTDLRPTRKAKPSDGCGSSVVLVKIRGTIV